MKSHFEEVRRMLNQEVDYVEEAESTRRAGELFGPGDGIAVPRVYSAYSGKRVLTTEYMQGLHLTDYLATNPTQASRNAFGTKMYIAWMRMYFAFMPYADPHPGNYLFLNDGRLGLLDFGCVQRYGPEEREIMRLADRMAYEDQSLIPEVIRRVCGVSVARSRISRIYEDDEGVVRLDDGAGGAARSVRLRRRVSLPARRGLVGPRESAANDASNPMYVYWNRSVFGIKAMLFRLRAQVDVHEVVRQERPAMKPGK